jgi:hypothetical protein
VIRVTGFVVSVAGFALIAVGSITPFVQRATFWGKEGPIRSAASNRLLSVGLVLLVTGLVIR